MYPALGLDVDLHDAPQLQPAPIRLEADDPAVPEPGAPRRGVDYPGARPDRDAEVIAHLGEPAFKGLDSLTEDGGVGGADGHHRA